MIKFIPIRVCDGCRRPEGEVKIVVEQEAKLLRVSDYLNSKWLGRPRLLHRCQKCQTAKELAEANETLQQVIAAQMVAR